MVLNAKFVVKSTTKISLNDRFSALRKLTPDPSLTAPIPTVSVKPSSSSSIRRHDYSAPVRPRFDLPYHPAAALRPRATSLPPSESDFDDYDDSRKLYRPVGRSHSLAERIADGFYLPPRRRLPAFEAAMNIKHRSIQQRVGGVGYYRSRGWYRGGGGMAGPWRPRFVRNRRGGFNARGSFRRSRSYQNLRRWNSSASLTSSGQRRRSYSGTFGSRGGRGAGRGHEDISRDLLDKELDEYMAGSQTVIDA